MKRWTLVLWLACFLSTLWADTNATLAGRISDPNGAMIPKAKVSVTNSDTGRKRATESNGEGLYVLDNLAPGRYQVQVEATGFETLVHEGVILRVQDIVTQNYSMKLGTVANSVSVESGASMVQADSGAVGTVIDRQFVENMPLNGRSFQSLIFLTPGVVLTATSATSQGQFSINGQRADANYFTIDGVSANFASSRSGSLGSGMDGSLPGFNGSGGTNGLVSADALQEFRIQTSSYSAEYGRTSGAQIAIVTHSGTNRYHGTLFEYFRNDDLDANNWFANSQRTGHPALRQNDFGGVLGGPLVLPRYNGRDRTFFFLSYEGLQLLQPQTTVTNVPSLSLRSSAAAGFRPLLNAFPLPTGPDNPTGLSSFAGSFSNPTRENNGSIRVDHTFKNTQLFFRYNHAPMSFSQRLAAAPSNLSITDNLTRTVTLGATTTITPHIMNDFRINFSSSSFTGIFDTDNYGGAVRPSDSILYPAFANPKTARTGFSLLLSGLNASFTTGENQTNITRQYNVIDTASFVLGKHLLKFGIDDRRLTPVAIPASYSDTLAITSLAALQSQTLSLDVVQAGTEIRPLLTNFSAFINDTWRATTRLTLSYGLRWEYNPSPSEATGKLPLILANTNALTTSPIAPPGTPIYQTHYLNFAPRLGFAYQLRRAAGHETVLRGGAGIFYDLGTNLALYAFQGYPFTRSQTFTNTPFPTQLPPPAVVANPPFPGNGYSYDQNANLPYTIQWSFAIEQALGRSQTLSASYTGVGGRKLPFFASYTAASGFKNPNFTTGVFISRNDLTSSYNGLELKYQRRLSHGLQALASYVWSHSIDEASDEATAVARRGDSAMDRRQALKIGALYNFPLLKGNAILAEIGSHWGLDALVTAVSAPPIDYLSTAAFDSNGTPIDQSANLLGGVPIYLSDRTVPGNVRLNPAAFTSAATNTVGTLGRNALRGLPLDQFDLSLHREFRLREGVKLQFRADSFNAFNHPNFGPFNTTAARTNPLYGVASAMYGTSLGAGGGVGGFNPLYQIGGPRSNQLSLKLVF